jgi:hypothetical protein
MQNKKMTNPTDGINESNKKLRAIYEQLCCLTTTTYNELDSVSISPSGSFTFTPGELHSVAWELGSGASVQISSGSTTTTFETNGNFSFSTLNTQTITITAVGGTVNLLYIY